MGDRFKWNQFGRLKNANDLEDYMHREYEHSNYFHYTSLNSIDSILKNNEFWISPISRFNDKAEYKFFENSDKENVDKYFSLCFSTGVQENLPLWYMYAGLDGLGGRLRFTKVQIKSLIEKGTYYLALHNSSGECQNICELKEDDFEIHFKDVLYFKKNDTKEGDVALKYNTMTNYKIPTSEFEKYSANNIVFVKYIVWFYEKETRLLIKLKKSLHEIIESKGGNYTEYAKDDKNYYLIKLSFENSYEIKKSIQITLAPEIESDKLYEKIDEYENLKKHMLKTSSISPSEYAGQIKMNLKDNLCKNCNKRK